MAHESFHFSPPAAGWSVFADSHQSVRRIPRGQIIYLQDEPGNCFYYLKKGRVRVFLISDEGSEKTLTVRDSGSIFGEAAFLDGQPRTTSARALTDCELVRVGRAELTALFRREPSLALQMLEVLAKTVRMLSEELDTVSFLPADRRLAGILLSLAGPGNTVCNSQEDLGSLAGVTRVTVSRVLHGFVQQGWVELQYRGVKITNQNALEEFAHNPLKK